MRTVRGEIRPVIRWRSLPMVIGGGTNVDFLGQVASPQNVGTLGGNAWGDVYVAETNLSNQPPHPATSHIYRIAPQ